MAGGEVLAGVIGKWYYLAGRGMKTMHIGVLSRNSRLYSTRRLVQAAHQRGHRVTVLDTMTVAVEVGVAVTLGPQPVKTIRDGLMPQLALTPAVDGLIPRIGSSITSYGLAVVRQFETAGVATTATAAAIGCSRDKLHSLQILAQAGLPLPKTAVLSQLMGLFPAVQSVGGMPVILKATQGTQGQQVILAHDFRSAQAAYQTLHHQGRQVLVQEFIAEAEGKDLRVFVVGKRCVAAMQRSAPVGEFRANLHRGGTAVPITLDRQTEKLAVAVAQAHHLNVAGVDLLWSRRGWLVLEVNSSPGLEGIERTTGVDVAEAIVTWLETAVHHQRRK